MPNGTRAATNRLPAGLTYSIIIATLSLGVLTLLGGLGVRGGSGPEPLVHTAAGLCLLWSLLAWVVSRRPGTQPWRDDLISVLQIACIVTGILASMVLVYAAILELFIRTRYFEYELPSRVVIWRSGVLDAGLLVASLALHWLRTRQGNLVTAAFWLFVLAGLWLSFGRPAARQVGLPGAGYQVPGDWASWFTVTGAATIALFTWFEGVLIHRRRVRAWPDALDDLVTPMPAWPGFDLSVGLVAAVILTVGCAHVLLPWTGLAGFTAGASVLVLVGRRWSENLADEGLALITLGFVSLCMLGFDQPVWTSGFTSVLSRAVTGLAVMTWLWHWLARVWAQQLDQGQPWTTAGRLIRTSRRVGFLIACTALLLSAHLAMWPRFPDVLEHDDSPGRWVAGLGANLLLLAALLSALRGTRRSTLGWLVLLTIASMIGFCLVRAPEAGISAWILAHWPFALAIAAGLCVIAAWATSRLPAWRAMQESLIFTGVVLAPVGAISGVTLTEADVLVYVPLWVSAGTFAMLGGVYLIAALYPGPSTFVTVTVLCGVMAFWHVRGNRILPPPYFYALLSGLCLTLVAVVYQRRGRPRFLQIVKWLGVGLAITALSAGWLMGRA